MGFKKQIRFLHKWLGLTSGLIVFIVSVTGCLFCFHDEIKDVTRKEWRFVEDTGKPYLPPSVLREKALEHVPNGKSGLVFYVKRDRAAVVYTYNENGNFYLFMNPYTGKTSVYGRSDNRFFHHRRIHSFVFVTSGLHWKTHHWRRDHHFYIDDDQRNISLVAQKEEGSQKPTQGKMGCKMAAREL